MLRGEIMLRSRDADSGFENDFNEEETLFSFDFFRILFNLRLNLPGGRGLILVSTSIGKKIVLTRRRLCNLSLHTKISHCVYKILNIYYTLLQLSLCIYIFTRFYSLFRRLNDRVSHLSITPKLSRKETQQQIETLSLWNCILCVNSIQC